MSRFYKRFQILFIRFSSNMNPPDYFGLPPQTLLKTPEIDPSAWIAPGAVVLGDVRLGPEASVWYQCVLRGDINAIAIGARTNIQDGSILHVENARACTVGEDVVVGHQVKLHACVIGDGALIGIGATVLSGAVIGKGAVVAAGALVLEGQEIPPGALAVGVPAKVVKQLPPDAIEKHRLLCAKYVQLARLHREKKPWPLA